MQLKLRINSITFSDGTVIDTSETSIVVLVGPNNVGKSSTLREIQAGAKRADNVGPVLQKVTFEKQGSSTELKAWLEENVHKIQARYEREPHYKWLGEGCPESEVQKSWQEVLDEPEAFLHPPHIKLLAGLLARSMVPNRQLIIATHSGDFLRSLLDANPSQLRIVRLIRERNVNCVHELDGGSIRTLWADPLLRFSNVLDSVFHDGVLLCESDSDCRFYSALLNAVLENRGEIAPDIMFTASGGNLVGDPELEAARTFIADIFDIGPQSGWCVPRPQCEVQPKIEPVVNVIEPTPRSSLWRLLLKKLGVKID